MQNDGLSPRRKKRKQRRRKKLIDRYSSDVGKYNMKRTTINLRNTTTALVASLQEGGLNKFDGKEDSHKNVSFCMTRNQ